MFYRLNEQQYFRIRSLTPFDLGLREMLSVLGEKVYIPCFWFIHVMQIAKKIVTTDINKLNIAIHS